MGKVDAFGKLQRRWRKIQHHAIRIPLALTGKCLQCGITIIRIKGSLRILQCVILLK